MCMNKVDFSLIYNAKSNAYIGVGYKKLHKDKVKKYGKTWHRATGSIVGDPSIDYKFLRSSVSRPTPTDTYHNGFHIFLNKLDAEDYNKKLTDHIVVKVEYKNVLGFGTNKTSGRSGPCVIAEYMRIVEIDNKPVLESFVETNDQQKLKVGVYYTLQHKGNGTTSVLDKCTRKVCTNKVDIVDKQNTIVGRVGDSCYKDYNWIETPKVTPPVSIPAEKEVILADGQKLEVGVYYTLLHKGNGSSSALDGSKRKISTTNKVCVLDQYEQKVGEITGQFYTDYNWVK